MGDATFRVIRYKLAGSNIALPQTRYTALAWNYGEAVLLGTRDYASYGEARAALDGMCATSDVRLRFFDGEYDCVDGELVPRSPAAKDSAAGHYGDREGLPVIRDLV